jgi:hypothetical protein
MSGRKSKDDQLSIVLTVAMTRRIAGLPPVMTKAAANKKYSDTILEAQIKVFEKKISAYMADFDLEMRKYATAIDPPPATEWDRLATEPVEDAEYIPLDQWHVVGEAYRRLYVILKKHNEDERAKAKAAWMLANAAEKAIDGITGAFDFAAFLGKYAPYILVGGGVLVAAYIIKK